MKMASPPAAKRAEERLEPEREAVLLGKPLPLRDLVRPLRRRSFDVSRGAWAQPRDAAVIELLKVRDLYDQQPTALAPFDPGKLKLLSDG